MKIKGRLKTQRTLNEYGFEVWEGFVAVGIMALMVAFAGLVSSQIHSASEPIQRQQQIENPNKQQIEDPGPPIVYLP